MSEQHAGRFAVLGRILRSWYVPAAAGLLVLLAFVWWVAPRKIDRVVSADGRYEWDASGAPPRRQVLWEPAQPLEALLPGEADTGSVFTPRLTDAGATLYFTYRPRGGHADIYRSRLIDGQWQQAEPVAGLNTEADDIGPVFSKDGRQVYFYSNRPGGHGGFDLYVSERTGSGWGKPRNLGPRVNSAAHEYDPALSPDGLSLYFASNRTPNMAQKATDEAAPAAGEWSATLRAHPGLTQFDLYVARRSSTQEEWAAPEALDELNTAANEGAPYVSPTGTFLYFASDRPARDGEAPNLDLYRARLVDGRCKNVESLGPGINTAAHETEPALSPEGFTLVFSSDRGGNTSLYQSTAQEVYAQTGLDTSNWQAVAAVWWQALLLTLLLSGLLALSLYSRGWLVEKASAARFVAGSALIHCLLLVALWGVPLASTVIQKAEEIRISEQASHFFEDDLPGSGGDGRPAFEKVADLRSVEPAPLPREVRKIVTPPGVPEPVESLVPTIPLQVARTLPPERLQFTAPAEEPALRPSQELPRRTGRAGEMAAAQPVKADPAPAEVLPVEKPIEDRPIVQGRQEATAPMLPVPELPRRSPQGMVGRPAAVEVNPNAQGQPEVVVQAPARTAERRQPGRIAEPAQTSEKVEAVAAATGPKEAGPEGAVVSLGRREDVAPPTAKEKPEGVARIGVPAARAEKVAETVQPKLDGDAPRVTPLAGLPGRAPSRARPTVEPAAIDPGPGAAAAAAPGEKPVIGATVGLPRGGSTLPEAPVRTPEKMTGPRGASSQPLIVGSVSDKPLDAPPSFSPLPGRLPRQPGRGTRVAQAEDGSGDKGPFLLRQDDVRKEAIGALGGTKESEAAVERGLDWLAAHQNRDGSWSLNGFNANCKHPPCTALASVASDPAGTGLALLPFLAAGNTPKAGKHQQTVAKGVAWLVQRQRADGGWLWPGDGRPMYGHALAAIALCETYGMTKDAAYRSPAQKALDFIVKAQHAQTGGWRYQPNTPGDTSVAGWQVMALKSGEMAGLTVPPAALEGAKRWLKSVEAPGGGQFGYQGGSPTPAMSAQGLLSLQLMGTRRDDPRMQAGAEYLLRNLPRREVDTSYYWYHATQVMYHMQGKYWKAWNEKMRDLLVSTQITKGPMAGTWDPVDARERTGGRICSTALRLLMLEVYYRHLPLYQQLEK